MAAKQGLSTILNSDAVGTEVSVCHRQGGCSSEVVVMRGYTVIQFTLTLINSKVSVNFK